MMLPGAWICIKKYSSSYVCWDVWVWAVKQSIPLVEWNEHDFFFLLAVQVKKACTESTYG